MKTDERLEEQKALALRLYEGIQLTRPLLRYITQSVDAAAQRHGVSVGERAVLEVLHDADQPLTAPDMTIRLDLTRQFVARMLASCKKVGFVQSIDNPGHKRSCFYELTPTGQHAIDAVRGAETDVLRRLLQDINSQEVKAYVKVQKLLLAEFSKGRL